MVNVITLLTDFGLCDSYVAQVKGVLLSRATLPLHIIDISHQVPPQDVRTGARLLREASLEFPVGTVHVAVVDPGVGTDRRIVAVELAGQKYVLPDNGLLHCLMEDHSIVAAHVLENSSLWRDEPSATFHGRDIIAPVAIFLAEGGELSAVGPAARELQRLTSTLARELSDGWMVEVIGVDHFGNVVTNGSTALLASLRDRSYLCVETAEKTWEVKQVGTYGEADSGELVALIGSQGNMELAQVNGSAARSMGLVKGNLVKIHRE